MPNQPLRLTALHSDRPRAEATHWRRLICALLFGCTVAAILAAPTATSLAQGPPPYYPGVGTPNAPENAWPSENRVVSYTQPYADNQAANATGAQLVVRDPRPNELQTEIVRPMPAAASYPNAISAGGQAWTGGAPQYFAQNPAGPEVIRPSVTNAQGVPQPGVAPSATSPLSEPARAYQGASPFDPTQFRLPTLGLPPGLGTPEPTPEVKKEYGQFVEREIAPENTIQVVVGRAKVIVLREKPRRIYIPDENVAGFQIVTDQEFAVVGKKTGRTVLNLWFPDPAIRMIRRRIGY